MVNMVRIALIFKSSILCLGLFLAKWDHIPVVSA
jgi:hypothetical protein